MQLRQWAYLIITSYFSQALWAVPLFIFLPNVFAAKKHDLHDFGQEIYAILAQNPLYLDFCTFQ